MIIDDLKAIFEEETDDVWSLMLLALILQPKEPIINIYIERNK